MIVDQMKRLADLTRFGSAWVAAMAVTGCMAATAPTAPQGAGSSSLARPTASDVTPQAAYGSTRRGVNETAAAVAAWLSFESGSRSAERLQVSGSADLAPAPIPAVPVPSPLASPSTLPVPVVPDAGSVPVALGGSDNGDGTLTITASRQGSRAEGPYTDVQTLTFAKQTRRPITYRDRLSVIQDGRTVVSQSRSKVWQADGRFTESVSIMGNDGSPGGTPMPWHLDATTQSSTDGKETTIGTLRRSDGSSLTLSRVRQGGRTTLEVTDARQNLKLSAATDNAQDIAALSILIDGQPSGSVDLPR